MTNDSAGAGFRLVACGPDGQPIKPVGPLPPAILKINQAAADFYSRAAYQPPWVGYLAVEGETIVGGGGFVAPPEDERVEIAYFTLPEHQGRGFARRTAAALVAIARAADASLAIYAKTAPEDGPSPAILKHLGFSRIGMVMDQEIGPAWAWLLG